ncbi:MAG TPA: sigma-70 family RNA polymerase sigma factor [Candidatus Dormibacteraeota bacterium]|nr:sigma-70 family RNA polymerase sigma factor [Candidatus Dormibacteraeota bacterium]
MDPSAGGAPVALRLIPGEAPLDWERVYRDNVASVYRLTYAKVGNRADAEDLTSQVFVGALPHLRADASSGEIHSYLVATARTVLAEHWRRRLGHPVTVIDEDHHQAAEIGAPVTDPLPRLRRILGMLPANYRRILELRFLEQRPAREAAATMGISVANARVMQHRALRRAAELVRGDEA